MLDIRMIRERPDEVRAALARRGGGVESAVDAILQLDERRRELVTRLDALRGERNRVSKEISGIRDAAARQPLIEAMRRVGDEIARAGGGGGRGRRRPEGALAGDAEPAASGRAGRRRTSTPTSSCATGASRASSTSRPDRTGSSARRWASSTSSAASSSAARASTCCAAPGARLQRALIAWMLDLHIERARLHRGLPAVRGQGARRCGRRPAAEVRATTSTTTPRTTSGSCRRPRCR